MAYLTLKKRKNIRIIIGIRIPLVEEDRENMRNVLRSGKRAVLDGSFSKLAVLDQTKSDRILGVCVIIIQEVYIFIISLFRATFR